MTRLKVQVDVADRDLIIQKVRGFVKSELPELFERKVWNRRR